MTITALFATAGATNGGLYPAQGLTEQLAKTRQFPEFMGRKWGGRYPAGLMIAAIVCIAGVHTGPRRLGPDRRPILRLDPKSLLGHLGKLRNARAELVPQPGQLGHPVRHLHGVLERLHPDPGRLPARLPVDLLHTLADGGGHRPLQGILQPLLPLHDPLGQPLRLPLETGQPGVARLQRGIDLIWVVASQGARKTLLRHEREAKSGFGR